MPETNHVFDTLTHSEVRTVLNAAEAAKLVRKLLADPKRWTKGQWAMTSEGTSVSCLADSAACWCLGGAVRRVKTEIERAIIDVAVSVGADLADAIAGTPSSNLIYEAIVAAAEERYPEIDFGLGTRLDKITRLNDRTDIRHADLLAVLDRAIELLETP